MNYRVLGKTDLQLSEIGIGAWQLGGPLVLDGRTDGHPELGREYCVELIRRCAEELGINFIDTAEQYGAGESERRVGEAIKGCRSQWIVSSKFGNQVGPNGERVCDASPRRVPISLEGTLKRLGTDYLDIYLYHIQPQRGEAETIAEILAEAKRKGMVRAVGISTNSLQDIEYLHSLGCLDVVQYAQNLLDPQEALGAYLVSHQVGCVVRGAFAGGRLSGKYFHSDPQFSPDDIRSNWMSPQVAEEYRKCAVFEQMLTAERGMIQLALRYLLDQPSTTSIIPGGKSIEDYRNAVRATEITSLTETEQELLGTLRKQILSV